MPALAAAASSFSVARNCRSSKVSRCIGSPSVGTALGRLFRVQAISFHPGVALRAGCKPKGSMLIEVVMCPNGILQRGKRVRIQLSKLRLKWIFVSYAAEFAIKPRALFLVTYP